MQPEEHKLWPKLKPLQQKFVKQVLATGDPKQAASNTYSCKRQDTAARIARRCLQNFKIYSTLIDCGFSVETSNLTRSASLALISRRLRNLTLDDGMFTKLMTLYVTVQGWGSKPGPGRKKDAANEEDVNELVMQLERKQKGIHG